MADEPNPLTGLLPTIEVIAAAEGAAGPKILTDIMATFTELLEVAHRQDHDAEERGGPHRRTRSMAEAQEKALLEAYADQPLVLARIITSVCVDIALYDPELHSSEEASRG